jgi:hypothetical protein
VRKSRLPTWYALFAALALPVSAGATLVYTYDFPGSPGSGLAVDQTNGQPSLATFSDFSRNGGLTQLPTANAFDSGNWPTTSFINLSVYDAFTITANSGYHLDLSQITFDELRAAGGPTKGRVVIFINGSTTAYATFNFNPTAQIQNQVFNFADITDANNATTVEFRFYGWNGGTTDAGLLFDNVAVPIDVVPEFDAAFVSALLLVVVVAHARLKRRITTDRDRAG